MSIDPKVLEVQPPPAPCRAVSHDHNWMCMKPAGHGGNHRRDRPVCPIPACVAERKPNQMMCRRHWFMVPKPVRDRIWATVRTDLGAYLEAHDEAIATVAMKEGAVHIAPGAEVKGPNEL
jgi:hypothetical protein